MNQDKMNQNIKVLIVDDDPDILFATARVIRKAGFKVFEASTGGDCLDKAKEIKPDLILLDIVLPDMNGLEICRRLKCDKSTAGIFISILSGEKIKPADQSNGLDTGADEYITRPIGNRELLSRVKAMVRIITVEKELEYQKQNLELLIAERTEELQKEIARRKKNHLDQKITLENLRAVFDSHPNVLAVVDMDRKIESINSKGVKLSLSSEENLVGHLTCGVLHCANYLKEKECEPTLDCPDCAVKNLIASTFKTKISHEEEGRIVIVNNGEKDEKFFIISTTLIKFNRSEKVLLSMTDITDRKRAERALEKSERRFRTIVNVLPQFVAHVDKDLNYKFVNQTYIDNFGIPKEKIVGNALVDVIGKSAFEKAGPHIKKVLDGEIVRYHQLYDYPTGKSRHIEGVLIPDISGKNEISGYYAVLSDISQYIEIQNDLMDSKSKFKGIIDNLPAVPYRFVLDGTGDVHFDYISYKCLEMFGISADDILNDANKIFDRIPDPDQDRVKEAIAESAKSLTQYDVVQRLVKPNGDLIWLQATATPQRVQNGDIVWDGLGMEITERVLADRALEKSYRDLNLRETIAELFLTSVEDELFNKILSELLAFFDCEYGYLGYISKDGDLVCPSMTREIWSKCSIPGKKIVFPANVWGGIWGESLKQQQSIFSNANLTLPEGHIGLNNAIAVPLISGEILVGQIVLAKKSDDLIVDDQKNLESLASFMAPILQMYLEKETAQKELKLKVYELKEKNIALNVLLENREEDKKKTMDTILNNHEKLISPYIDRLKLVSSKEDAWTLAGIIETNIQESLSPFEHSFSATYRKFTPMEVQVADLIKSGKTSKEIAGVLHLSLRTVGFHRDNIRKKLDINKAKVNLRTFLQSFD